MTGVRSAIITLQTAQTPMRIILFPMVHAAAPDFYKSVTARLGTCRLIVAEGISGRPAAARALTVAYRLPAHSRRLALTVQNIDYASLGTPVLRPDLTSAQFRERWRSVPILQRLAVWCLVPPFALAFTLLGTRRILSRYLALDDMPTPAAEQARQATRELTELILDHRDALLIDCLEAIHQAHHTQHIDVAVVYGAEHMPAIAHELLRRHDYRPRSAEWLTVFDF